MLIQVNRQGVQLLTRGPNGGMGTFPLFGRGRPLYTLRRIPLQVRRYRAFRDHGRLC